MHRIQKIPIKARNVHGYMNIKTSRHEEKNQQKTRKIHKKTKQKEDPYNTRIKNALN